MKAIYTMALALFAAVLLSLPLFLNSCKKTTTDPPPTPVTPQPCATCLPDITTTGKNTFGCKVNGKIWLPETGWLNQGTRLEYSNKHLIIHAYNYTKREYIDLDVAPITDTIYCLFYDARLKTQWSRYVNENSSINYNSDTIMKGFLRVSRFDLLNGIVSGTFEFDTYNSKVDTAYITEGRFDLHF